MGIAGVNPTASSDGSMFVFEGLEEGLYRIDFNGRNKAKLASDGTWGDIAPDDQHVVFVSSQGGRQSIWTMPLGGGEAHEIVDRLAVRPRLAADGRKMLFGLLEDQEPVFVVCDLPRCSGQRSYGSFLRIESGGRWHPREAAFAAVDRATRSNVWIQPLDGSPPRQLTHFTDGAVIDDFAWSHDGKRLAIARSTTTNDIVLFKGLKGK